MTSLVYWQQAYLAILIWSVGFVINVCVGGVILVVFKSLLNSTYNESLGRILNIDSFQCTVIF